MGDPDLVGDVRRLIVFDLDGTLIDSRRDLADSANQLIGELGGQPLREEAIGRMVGEGARVLVRRALAAAGLGDPPGALDRFMQIYDARLLNHTVAYDGMLDVVGYARRHARLAVLTNKPLAPSEQILAALGMREVFDDVVGGDGPLPRKPDPAGLLALMERAGASRSTTLMVGDSAIDHETARRAEVRCCLTSYGFGYMTFPPQRLAGDEWIVMSPGELCEVIDAFVTGSGIRDPGSDVGRAKAGPHEPL
jgi:phosphoglycolate phosphatase